MSVKLFVLGATGAVGREAVVTAVNDPSDLFSSVVAFSRRNISEDSFEATFPGISLTSARKKLKIHHVDYDTISAIDFAIPSNENVIGAVLCCLGTTRADAGAAGFKKVDLTYVSECAKYSKLSNVRYFGLVSASNANSQSYFLYPQTKRLAEDAVISQGFPSTTIFRPGLLERKDKARLVEKIASWIIPSVPVSKLANVMVQNCVSVCREKKAGLIHITKF